MAHLVLSRKLRPKTFEEVAGQDHIVNALKNSIKTDRLGHAYLFAGTRGVGKTTIARIFAKAIRCESRDANENPCGECVICQNSDVDIIEIDGASNNSVENVRNLISTVQYLPTHGKYRVYIIDEVHMLSQSAFNALLKTLEEPPEHVKILFATTDPQKLIDTVLSRCIRFDLRPLSQDRLVEIVDHVLQSQSVSVDSPKVVELIAKCANGSLRDALSLLEQALSYSENNSINFQSLEDSLGIANLEDIQTLVNALISEDEQTVSSMYRTLVSKGIFLKNICESILDNVYERINSTEKTIGLNEGLWIFETLGKDFSWALAKETVSPSQVVELVLKKVCLRRQILGQREMPQSQPVQTNVDSKKDTEELKKKILSESMNHLEESEKRTPEETKSELVAPVEEPSVEMAEMSERDLSFAGLLEHIGKYSPAMKTNLQHGNFLKELKVENNSLDINVAFKDSAQVFADYFHEQDIKEKLVNWSKEFFNVDQVVLNITVLKSETEKDNFSSVNERIMAEEEEEKQNLRDQIHQNENVKLAEELFHSKVDKVVLKEE